MRSSTALSAKAADLHPDRVEKLRLATGLAPRPALEQARQPSATWSPWAVVSVLLNPGRVVSDSLRAVPWFVALFVSGSAFGLFFLQTCLDLARVGRTEATWPALVGSGLLLGTVGVTIVAFLAWLLTRVFRGDQSPGEVMRAFALCYSPALVSGISGLACNLLLGWNTTLAFGVTGFVWALGPMFMTFRQLTGERAVASAVLATLCGGVLLVLWYLVAAGG